MKPKYAILLLCIWMPCVALAWDYPVFGTNDLLELPALWVQHANGDQTLELYTAAVETDTTAHYTDRVYVLRDSLYPVEVRLCYRTYTAYDLWEIWMEITHQEKKPIVLKRFDSGHFTIPQGDVWMTHFHGNWAAEGMPVESKLERGTLCIQNTDGARNAHVDAPSVVFSLDGRLEEYRGRTVAATLCWSGNYELRCTTANDGLHHFYAGISPQASEYVLSPKETFRTPHLAVAYSEAGMHGCSRIFHRWAREERMITHPSAPRPVLLNSWEGIYFDITEERMIAMIDDIADMGGELFVMDDGWFGGKYARNTDNAALGDWQVDTRKLPNGLQPLIDHARARGIRFGIWIEPESTNTLSELYEQHPDWVLRVPGRQLRLGRGGTQLLLDMTNPQVQDFVFRVVDNLLTAYPDIAYIKWDANTSLQNYGSPYLPKDKQSNLYIAYHQGLQKTLQRIRAKYPDVIIQNCASGGGRANYGLMPYFDEMWVSDNNDALQRLYIWWTASYFFPANTLAQHVGGSPYHMTGRSLPVKFRCDVAMFGRMGLELNPRHMTPEEQAQCAQAVRDYKLIRPLVQQGDLYRLVSPYAGKHIMSLMFVNDSQTEAVLFAFRTEYLKNQYVEKVQLRGLDPDKSYRIEELDVVGDKKAPRVVSGKELMEEGIALPLNSDYASVVYKLSTL
ncbi:MAG: alpha-galactosidase [Paludibacteraceae bacterium]